MLSCLTIENIALISHGEIRFTDGFVVFTGETGAGKSIIIDSIALILGSRANKELIRSGEQKAKVEALFESFNDIEKSELAKLEIDTDDGQLLLSREIYTDGRSVAKINGKTVTVSMLRDAASHLVNIHGQHECQLLTDSQRHLELLDLYAENKELRNEYSQAYKNAKDIQKRIIELSGDEKEKRQRADYLKYTIEEIDKVSPKENELETLKEKKDFIEQNQKLTSSVSAALGALNGGDDSNGACSAIKIAADAIESAKSLIPDGDKLSERLAALSADVSDITSEISRIGTDGFSDEDVDKIEERMYAIEKLCKKYGGSVKSVIETRESSAAELTELENIDDSLKILADEYKDAKAKLAKLGAELSASRKSASESLCKKVCEELEFLDMPGVRFLTKAEEYHNAKGGIFYTADGTEKTEFLISANVGEEPKPLAKIASGGELSRIILAIKSALNEKEGTGTLIFDEVDTGISGKTSYKVGLKLYSASRSSQVFCVTHSAQIASLADTHIKVSKSSDNGRAYTVATELTSEQRTMEIARIMGGDIISKTLLDSARELLAQSETIKNNRI